MAHHPRHDNAHLFHGGMKGLAIGAIAAALLAMIATGTQALFFAIPFGAGIGFFAGILAARRHERLSPAYAGPDRRASLAAYQGIDRRTH